MSNADVAMTGSGNMAGTGAMIGTRTLSENNAIAFDDNVHKVVRFLVGGPTVANSPLCPYDEEACAFLAEVSGHLLHGRAARDYPDVAAFAYWCRKSNIAKLKAKAEKADIPLNNRLGRGLAFHIAPSNIPVNFAFSFAFALLAGNANIVRVPSAPFVQTQIICDAIQAVLADYPSIAQRTALVSYGHEDMVTEAFSSVSDARIIWGGDATVKYVKASAAKPRCKDIAFPDRYSIALIEGDAICSASDEELAALTTGFYNDTYLMDQNACSSPQMIFWKNADTAAKRRFWDAAKSAAKVRYALQPAVVMDKYVHLCSDIIDGIVSRPIGFDGMLTVVNAENLCDDISILRGKGGYFYEHDIASLDDIEPFVNDRYQTMLYYGFDARELQRFVVDRHMRGIDRIVPFGSAMDIDIIWDGYDLVTELSRIVDVR